MWEDSLTQMSATQSVADIWVRNEGGEGYILSIEKRRPVRGGVSRFCRQLPIFSGMNFQ